MSARLPVLLPLEILHHALNKTANISDTIHSLDKFDVIPSSIFCRIKINPLKLKDKISSLRRRYDIILIDSSSSLNEEILSAMIASDELFVVTTPDYSTLSRTLKAVKLAKQRRTPINGLILNKVHNKNFELSIDEIEKTAEVPVLAVIPYDINVLRALSEFMPSTAYRPKSAGSKEYRKLAALMIGEKYKPFKARSLFRITPKRQDINREIFYERVFG